MQTATFVPLRAVIGRKLVHLAVVRHRGAGWKTTGASEMLELKRADAASLAQDDDS